MRFRFPVLALMAIAALDGRSSRLSEVNPFIGTSGNGHSTPGAACPFGLVQAGPDTGWGTWDYCSGYQFGDTNVIMFSQTHTLGGGCPDYGDVGIMPVFGEVKLPVRMPNPDPEGRCTTSVERGFHKTSERASPGYYGVTLDGGVRVEVTASEHCAFYRLTYPAPGDVALLVDLAHGMGSNHMRTEWAVNRAIVRSAIWQDGELNAHLVKQTWVQGRHVGAHFVFSPAPTAVEELPRASADTPPQYVARFRLRQGEPLLVKIGLSASSGTAARANVEAEMSGWDFAAALRRAETKWQTLLSRMEVKGGSRDDRAVFATALYRQFLQPQNLADAGERPYYSEFAFWDTFRAEHPLFTLITPEKVPEFVRSILLHRATKWDRLPVLPKWGIDTQCMIGTHAVSVLAEAYVKGFGGVDWAEAYQAIRETLLVRHGDRSKEDWDVYDRYGYYPFDLICGESVSRTLECSYDDWCALRLAERFGSEKDIAVFRRRASGWTNVFDRTSGFMRGKDVAGRWREPFDPFEIGFGKSTANDFTEANAWQYSWHVLQDPEGLIAALGGGDAAVRRLDALFSADAKREGAAGIQNVSGMIGQYAHGNEPSHHIAYFYSLAGRQDLAAMRVREVCRKFYRNAADGICGNEDHGQMSAWYLWACLGFYPLCPASGEYVLAVPQFPELSVDLGGGRVLRIVVNGRLDDNLHVREVRLNGRRLDRPVLRHADIAAGGELVFDME